jgi:hypothetical protein
VPKQVAARAKIVKSLDQAWRRPIANCRDDTRHLRNGRAIVPGGLHESDDCSFALTFQYAVDRAFAVNKERVRRE